MGTRPCVSAFYERGRRSPTHSVGAALVAARPNPAAGHRKRGRGQAPPLHVLTPGKDDALIEKVRTLHQTIIDDMDYILGYSSRAYYEDTASTEMAMRPGVRYSLYPRSTFSPLLSI